MTEEQLLELERIRAELVCISAKEEDTRLYLRLTRIAKALSDIINKDKEEC